MQPLERETAVPSMSFQALFPTPGDTACLRLAFRCEAGLLPAPGKQVFISQCEGCPNKTSRLCLWALTEGAAH